MKRIKEQDEDVEMLNDRLQNKRVKIIQYQNLLIKEKIDNENSLHALKRMIEKFHHFVIQVKLIQK